MPVAVVIVHILGRVQVYADVGLWQTLELEVYPSVAGIPVSERQPIE